MRFCPKCGGILVPYKKENEAGFRCSKCGYEIQQQSARYTISVQQPKVFTTSVISEGKTTSRKKEEIEQEREEYYKELFMELLREEEYGGEEI
ncbi:MAG: DNA-directed RNA polymerase subunit M [Ignisphaera sp.]